MAECEHSCAIYIKKTLYYSHETPFCFCMFISLKNVVKSEKCFSTIDWKSWHVIVLIYARRTWKRTRKPYTGARDLPINFLYKYIHIIYIFCPGTVSRNRRVAHCLAANDYKTVSRATRLTPAEEYRPWWWWRLDRTRVTSDGTYPNHEQHSIKKKGEIE